MVGIVRRSVCRSVCRRGRVLGKVACGWELESEEHHLELGRGLEERRIQFASAVASAPLDFRASVPVWRNRQKLPRGLSAATYHSIPAARWRCKSTVLVLR